MFIGEYRYTIDEKGRLAIPAKFRSRLGETAIITRGLDTCLFLYSAQEWQRLVDELNSLPLAQANARAYSRFFLSGAFEVTFDKLGRCIVPQPLRHYAKVNKEVSVIGVSSRIEVWDSQAWQNYKQKAETDSGMIAEGLMV